MKYLYIFISIGIIASVVPVIKRGQKKFEQSLQRNFEIAYYAGYADGKREGVKECDDMTGELQEDGRY